MNTISFLKYNNFIMGLGPQGKIYFHRSLEEESWWGQGEARFYTAVGTLWKCLCIRLFLTSNHMRDVF